MHPDKIIPWHDLLLLLEGQTVHLPAPKTHHVHAIEFTKDTPIFATSKDEIVYVRGGAVDARKCGMMRVRWHIFQFQVQMPQAERVNISPCPHCFSEFITAPSQST